MTSLSEALQSLIHYFKIEIEQGCIIFNPGLLKTEIEEITRTLPFCLSQEIYELYSWSNGNYIEAYFTDN